MSNSNGTCSNPSGTGCTSYYKSPAPLQGSIDNEEVLSINENDITANENDIAANANACCQAMTAECLACGKDLSVNEYCEQNPGTEGCESNVDPEAEAIDAELQARKEASAYFQEIQRQILRIYLILILLGILVFTMY